MSAKTLLVLWICTLGWTTEDIEMCCDAQVLRLLSKEEGVRYGLLLIQQGEWNSSLFIRHRAGVHWFAGQSQLTVRVRQIARQVAGKPKRSRFTARFSIDAAIQQAPRLLLFGYP
ncbi:hypothetical protein [Paenibacillus sp. FSL H7-0331]|uniref:hypothetical protein n=1 Tax=Paenibacillus sp. FSL H7-0331 TaxID=1920421 RepID=UPI0015C3166A|nr:hypothetical protein [Paenibacillus sp. FSL H7-0331]